jgi:uncharacterized protein YggL (DUF469 family)
MNKWERRYNRRQRKKLRRGEFQEFGFFVSACPLHDIAYEDRYALMNAFIEQAIEENGLLFGGGFNEEFSGYVMVAAPRASATLAHVDIVRAWLSAQHEWKYLRVGPLSDSWYWHEPDKFCQA